MFLKRGIIIVIVLILPFFVHAQFLEKVTKNVFFEADLGYGFIMPHHKSIEYTLEDHIKTLDFKFLKPAYGNKYWNQLYRYPYYGMGYYRSNLGNDSVYGFVNALYSFVKVPFLGASDKMNVSWQIAFGASYITKSFDIESNPQNLAIGSHLNIYIDFSLQSVIPVSKKISISNSVRFTHVSNGKVKSPNKGLNVFSGSLGIIYQFGNSKPEKRVMELPAIEKRNEYCLVYSSGVKTMSRYEQGYYYASSLVFDYKRNYSLKGRWITGLDVFFDATNKQFSKKTGKKDMFNSDLYQAGIHAGHETVMGNLSLVINAGAYFYTPVEVLAPVYSRVGLQYRIRNKIITNFTLKSHWAKASYIEWGIGYVF